MRLSYPVARLLGRVAEQEAEKIGVPMAVAITDAHGGLVFFGKMDKTLPASTDIAMGKAYTAAVLRLPTDEVGRQAQPGMPLYGIEQTNQGRIVLFGGGLPLRLHGEVVGGVGISGGTVEQDIMVAKPVVAALEKMGEVASLAAPLLTKGIRGRHRSVELANAVRTAVLAAGRKLSAWDEVVLSGGLLLGLQRAAGAA